MILRKVLVVAAAALAAAAADAQTYPARPVRIIVPFAPGGATDVLARLFGQRLLEWYGQAGAVDNRPGAGGNIGAELVKPLAHPTIKSYIEREGGYAIGGTPKELEQVIAQDIEKYAKVIKASGARPGQ